MTVPLMLQLQVQEKVQECLKKVLGEGGKHFSITLAFKKGMGAVAGEARSSGRIDLNEQMFLGNKDVFFNEIIPHEVAHVLQFVMFPEAKRHHGKEWKMLMKMLNVPSLTYHSMDASATDTSLFRYSCSCGANHSLTKLRHKRSQAGKTMVCSDCETRLIYYPREGECYGAY